MFAGKAFPFQPLKEYECIAEVKQTPPVLTDVKWTSDHAVKQLPLFVDMVYRLEVWTKLNYKTSLTNVVPAKTEEIYGLVILHIHHRGQFSQQLQPCSFNYTMLKVLNVLLAPHGDHNADFSLL